MLPEAAFDTEIKAFIQKNKDSSLADLLLKRPGNKNWDWLWIGQQIEGYQKAKQKIPSLANLQDIVFPKRLSLQQCSSDLTAAYKANLFSGSAFLDLSGGFGIDTLHLSDKFNRAVYVEKDRDLCEIMSHNCRILGLSDKIEIVNKSAEEFLEESDESFDLIYIDPARRNMAGNKIFRFSECSPDVIMILEMLKSRSKKILIKAAPMLDISQGVRELKYVEKVHVLANSRECKELLFVLGDELKSNPELISVQLDSHKEFSFYPDDELVEDAVYKMEGKYLYNPGPAISKSAGYKILANRFNLNIIHPNTHLFVANHIKEDFPGKIYKILDFIAFGSKYDFGKAGFTIYLKNFPFEKREIMKKYKIREGEEMYLFAFRSTSNKNLIAICESLF